MAQQSTLRRRRSRVLHERRGRERARGAVGALCLLLGWVSAGLSAYWGADCERSFGPSGWSAFAAGALVMAGVFLLSRKAWVRWVFGVAGGIVVALIVAFIAFAAAMGNCFEI